MKTCFDHNSPKSSPIRSSFCTHTRRDTFSLLQVTKPANSTRKMYFSNAAKNAAAPSLPELPELLTHVRKKNCCMQNYSLMLIAPKLSTINADRAENCYTSSTDRGWDLIQIWTQTVPITKSYDQNKFSIVFINKTIEKIAIFEKSFLGLINEFLNFFFTKRENTQ